MPRIRITGILPKAKYGQVTTGDPDDEWIKKILEYESKSGSSSGTGLSNFGYNDWQKFGHNHAPTSMDEAVEYFKQDFLPKVKDYPMGVRERLADYMYNTGRSPKDLLLRAADRITLDDLNSSKTWDDLYESNKNDLEKLYQDPKFLEKIDNAKTEVYKTTPDKANNLHYTLDNPNPAYDKTWKNRISIFSAPVTTSQPVTSTSVPKQDDNLNLTKETTTPTQEVSPQETIPTIKFKNDVTDIAPPEMSEEEKKQAEADKNYQNWLQKPQNDMSTRDWAQDFQKKFNLNPTYDPNKKYDNKGNEIETTTTKPKLNWGQKFGNWTNKAFDKFDKAMQTPTKIANTVQTGLVVGNAITSYIDNEKTAREMKRKQLQSRFNAPVVNPEGTVGSRGDYTINDGTYDPRRYVVNKGMYTNELSPGLKLGEYGGELDKMAYGGDIIDQPVPDMPLDLISLDVPSKQPSLKTSSETNLTSVDASSSDSEYFLPLKQFKITSGFGHRKAPQGPHGPASSEHNGLDLAAPVDTDVFAPMNGVVKSIYSNSQGGNQLIIEHEDGSRTGYAHLNGYKVKIGDNVAKGQVIAFSGNTGNSNGPHLHFTYRNANGDLVDPRTVFNFNIGSPKKTSSSSLDPTITNNPLNIHYGDFTKKYGATIGGEDNGGNVARFPTPEVGVKATKDLLNGPGYAGAGLTVSQARNKWVTGNPNTTNPSTADIVKAMGGDKKLTDLSPEEFNKLLVLFAKWENKKSPEIIKKYAFEEGGEVGELTTYDEGGEYELTEDEIRQILENGGDVEFI